MKKAWVSLYLSVEIIILGDLVTCGCGGCGGVRVMRD